MNKTDKVLEVLDVNVKDTIGTALIKGASKSYLVMFGLGTLLHVCHKGYDAYQNKK